MTNCFSRGLKRGAFGAFITLTSVDNVLLLGRAGSLSSYARILSGLREDFLRGVGKLTRCTSQREGIVSSRGGRAIACKESTCCRTGEDKKEEKPRCPQKDIAGFACLSFSHSH